MPSFAPALKKIGLTACYWCVSHGKGRAVQPAQSQRRNRSSDESRAPGRVKVGNPDELLPSLTKPSRNV
jgi:hypothetical protein